MLQRLVNNWCEAHNSWDLNRIRLLYAQNVVYYGHKVSVEELIRDKSQYFRPNDAFKMAVVSPVRVSEFAEGIKRCDFTKEVFYKGEKRRYEAYLLVNMESLDPEIVAESDLESDKSAGYTISAERFRLRAGTDSERPAERSGTWVYYVAGGLVVFGGAIVVIIARRRRG